MKNPIKEDLDQETLLLDKNFHIKFIQDHGFSNWQSFVSDTDTQVPENSLAAKIFPHSDSIHFNRKDKPGFVWIYQKIIEWMPIGEVTDKQEDITMQTKVILRDGDSLQNFAKEFSSLIPNKFSRQSIIDSLGEMNDNQDARDAGYNMFSGVKDYQATALKMIKKLFKNEKQEIYGLFLKCGFHQKANSEHFLEFLLENDISDVVSNLTEQENENRITIYDYLKSGMIDAFSDVVAWKYKQELEKAFTEYDFPNAKVEFDKDGEWRVYTYLGTFIDYYIEMCTNKHGSIKYTVSESDIFNRFLEADDKFSIPEEYPYPDEKDIDVDYAYSNFHEQIHELLHKRGILP